MILLFVLFLATDVSAGLYCWLPCDDGVTICDGVAPRLWPDVQMILGQWRPRGEHKWTVRTQPCQNGNPGMGNKAQAKYWYDGK